MNERVAAFVTFHYRLHTMPFLDRVLRNLHDFLVARMHVTIVTSLMNGPELDAVNTVCRNYFDLGDFAILSRPDCDPPFMLTWEHKPLLKDAASSATDEFTHFVYVEDDIGLTYRNFVYFAIFADALRAVGLIPSFLRTEFSNGTIRACDAPGPTRAPQIIEVQGQAFVNPQFPYCGCFIMDRLHVEEYVASRSFDPYQSTEVVPWGVPERAAMGLCWESPPVGFGNRYALPVGSDLRAKAFCQVTHMPSNYATTHWAQLGKLPVEHTFLP